MTSGRISTWPPMMLRPSSAVSITSASGGSIGGSLTRSSSGIVPLAADTDTSSTGTAGGASASAAYLRHGSWASLPDVSSARSHVCDRSQQSTTRQHA